MADRTMTSIPIKMNLLSCVSRNAASIQAHHIKCDHSPIVFRLRRAVQFNIFISIRSESENNKFLS
jgi:hypothetical protein